jgi:hypothetical protein
MEYFKIVQLLQAPQSMHYHPPDEALLKVLLPLLGVSYLVV